jgi:polyisoprenoid-binding protein YceI
MTATDTAAQTYSIDPAHSSVEFVIRHMMIAKVRGRFTGLAGTISVPAGTRIPDAVSATLQVASVNTNEAQRDAHLASPDFFDAAAFPEITFTSTSITPGGDGFTLVGDLTIHGVTKSVSLEGTYEGDSIDPYGNKRVGYEAHGKINRKDFGLVWNAALETGGVAVGEDVKIELSIEGLAA